MYTASVSEIKKEIAHYDEMKLSELCLRLARFKKDNKELLTYLLFESDNEQGYIQSIKSEIDEEFETLNTSQIYLTKKGLRKILRNITKYIRYSGSKQTEVEILLHFCKSLKDSAINRNRSVQITNLYNRQKIKIEKALSSLHEDLQVDYFSDFEYL